MPPTEATVAEALRLSAALDRAPRMSAPLRLLLVDHQALLRRCLATLLNRRRGLHVVGEAATGAEARARARALRPDVVVVEPEVPDGGPGLVADLCRELSRCSVVVLTAGDGHDAASQALRAGARGYLRKACELDDLLRAIERVRVGELVVAPEVADGVLNGLGNERSPAPRADGLTGRELEVLRLISQGRTNPEIARELSITEHTVKGHLAKILGKLRLGNRVQLATYAMQRGIATRDEAAVPS